MKKVFVILSLILAASIASAQEIGETTITKWPDGKRGAVSITYDDGTTNQFRIAVPIMDRLDLPGTFYIMTSKLPGSTYTGKHIGRPWQQIAKETETIPTDEKNVFERASAMRYVPVVGANETFTRAGQQIDAGRMDEFIKVVDDFYDRLNAGSLETFDARWEGEEMAWQQGDLTWDMASELTARGHELSSHMVTHPYMSALDAPNIMYELEASRAEIAARLGVRSTLVGEMPYDTNDPRATNYARSVFPASRSRSWFRHTMESYRPGDTSLPESEREYTQSRNTVYTRTTLEQMNAWADHAASQGNVWYIPVIHGIDGIGWEAMKKEDLEAHFEHIVSLKDKLWVATFGDVARYVRERMSAHVSARVDGSAIAVEVDHPLDKTLFDLPLTLKTYVDPAWNEVGVTQGDAMRTIPVQRNEHGAFVIYNAVPGGGEVFIREN